MSSIAFSSCRLPGEQPRPLRKILVRTVAHVDHQLEVLHYVNGLDLAGRGGGFTKLFTINGIPVIRTDSVARTGAIPNNAFFNPLNR